MSDLLFADVANKETFINSQEAVSSYMDFIRWVKTDEGKASRNKKIEEILSKIPNEYTLKELCE